jgi:tetratricopeptide (TPR) repeat protein
VETITETMARGWEHVQRGAWPEAEQVFHEVLQAKPNHADALYLLGVSTFRLGKTFEALDHLTKAAQFKPEAGFIHYHLGLVKRALGRAQEAIAEYQEAIRLQPDMAEAHNNLGVTLQSLGKVEEALAAFRQAARCKPDYAEAHNNLGAVYQLLGRPAEAVPCYSHAIRLKPSYTEAINNRAALVHYLHSSSGAAGPETAEAHFHRGMAFQNQELYGEATLCYEETLVSMPDYAEAHNSLGAALHKLGKTDEALASFQQAVRCRPTYAEAHNNLGIALQVKDRVDDAIASYRQAVHCKPDLAEAYNNLGEALHVQGKSEEAFAAFEQAVRSRPDYAEAHANLGFLLEEQGKQSEALARFEKALQCKPEYPEAHMARAFQLLLQGNFDQGWSEYEWRMRCKKFPTPAVPGPKPAWDGYPLGGRTILLRAEQGLGDALQFVRYAPLVHERGGKVIVECQAPLIPLFRTVPGIDRVLDEGESLPDFDVHAMLMSVPGLLLTKLSTIPAKVPYLSADPALVEHWRKEISKFSGFKIGIVWQGRTEHLKDRLRSVPLSKFASVARVPGVQLLGLQVGAGQEQIAALTDPFPVADLAPPTISDLAAAIKNVDLVIAVDTAPAHLAGALAMPVWVALSYGGEWRWLLCREDSPWYPTMRLFRQKRPGDWDEVFARIASEVVRLTRKN